MEDVRMNVIDPHRAILAQSIFCAKNEIPRLASIDGVCPECDAQIYESIKVADAASKQVVGCPVCKEQF